MAHVKVWRVEGVKGLGSCRQWLVRHAVDILEMQFWLKSSQL